MTRLHVPLRFEDMDNTKELGHVSSHNDAEIIHLARGGQIRPYTGSVELLLYRRLRCLDIWTGER